MKAIFYLLLISNLISCSSTNSLTESEIQKSKDEILTAMNVQERDWNNGDIDAFMESYWKSAELSFISSRGPTYGWDQTKSNYKKGYPSKEAMGNLQFEIIQLDPISADAF